MWSQSKITGGDTTYCVGFIYRISCMFMHGLWALWTLNTIGSQLLIIWLYQQLSKLSLNYAKQNNSRKKQTWKFISRNKICLLSKQLVKLTNYSYWERNAYKLSSCIWFSKFCLVLTPAAIVIHDKFII